MYIYINTRYASIKWEIAQNISKKQKHYSGMFYVVFLSPVTVLHIFPFYKGIACIYLEYLGRPKCQKKKVIFNKTYFLKIRDGKGLKI